MRAARSSCRSVLALCATAFLAMACAPQTAPNAPAPSPIFPKDAQEAYEFIEASLIAESIAEGCPKEFQLDKAAEEKLYRAIDARFPDQDFVAVLRDGFPVGLDAEAIAQRYLAYAKKRKVVFADNQTWCPAGRAEIAEKTRIGSFLNAR